MKKLDKKWILLFMFGSLWGLSEVIAGEAFFSNSIPYSSVWLTAWALFILALARGILNQFGTSTLIGTFASLFKLVNAAPFICHLLGIFFLGLAFDIAASLLMKSKLKIPFCRILTGMAGAYGGLTLFALVITYIVRYEYWAAEGLPKVLRHIFVSGSLAALAAGVVVPIGYWIGVNGVKLSRLQPRWAYSSALLATTVFWIMGRLAG